MEYKDFVSSLVKSGEVMENEITNKEEHMLDLSLVFCDKASKIKETCYDVLHLYSFIKRSDVLEMKHMLIGIVGECGEITDPVKGIILYRKSILSLNKEGKTLYDNIVEEIGDLSFFINGLIIIFERLLKYKEFEKDELNDLKLIKGTIENLNAYILYFINSVNKYIKESNIEIGPIFLIECIRLNEVKLQKRYEGKYSDKKAIERNDKNV